MAHLLNHTGLCSLSLHCISINTNNICSSSFEQISLDLAKLILAIDLQLPKVDVFHLASKWCLANKASDADVAAVMNEVRLPLIPAHELLHCGQTCKIDPDR